jgi:predicted O-methyltransferase YrrM
MDIQNQGNYDFTRNWFRNRNLATFRDKIHPVFGRRPTVYLELGVFEGMSMVWMLQHVLVHPGSRGVGVDPWLMTTKLNEQTMEAVYQRALHNTSQHSNCVIQRGNSAEVLRKMNSRGFHGIGPCSVDLCMVDGNHNALAVLDDARLVYQLLKPGGMMLFDDVENDIEKTDHVKQGVEMFLLEVGSKMRLDWKLGYCEAYIKE